jgi:hypothetical protein
MRSDERYFADIRHAIRRCEMCGAMVDIINCYDLRNTRTGKVIVCGEKCIARYAEVIAQTGQTPSIVFPHQYREKAEKVNQHRRDTVAVEDEPGTESSND